MRVPITAVFAALGAAACNDPVFDVAIDFVTVPGAAPANDLEAKTAEVIVKVIDATAAGTAAGLPRDATCDDLAYRYLDPAVLDGATRTSMTAGRGASLRGVPRLGQKLVLVEARNENGRLFGAGCTPWGDVETDALVPVLVDVAPAVRLLARVDGPTTSARLLLTTPWDETLPLPGHAVRTELYTGGPCYPVDGASGDPEVAPGMDRGIYETPQLPPAGAPPPPPGPATTIARVRWAETPVRLPTFVAWEKMRESGPGGEIALGLPIGGSPRGWAVGLVAQPGADYTNLAATVQRRGLPPNDEEQIAVVRRAHAGGNIELMAVDAPDARAAVMYSGDVYTIVPPGPLVPGGPIVAGGWRKIEEDGALAEAGAAVGEGPAFEIHNVRACDGSGAGFIVRRFERAETPPGEPLADPVLTYRAYSGMRVLGGSLAPLAATIQAEREQIMGSGCLSIDRSSGSMIEGVLLSRTPQGVLRARLVPSGTPVAVPNAAAITTFPMTVGEPPSETVRWFAAGVELTITGPRVSAYKVAEVGAAASLAFVGIDTIGSELAALPASMDVGMADGDEHLDVVAAGNTPQGTALQINLGRRVDRMNLSAITPPEGGQFATSGLVRFIDADGAEASAAHDELMVLTDSTVDVYRLPWDVMPGTCEP